MQGREGGAAEGGVPSDRAQPLLSTWAPLPPQPLTSPAPHTDTCSPLRLNVENLEWGLGSLLLLCLTNIPSISRSVGRTPKGTGICHLPSSR